MNVWILAGHFRRGGLERVLAQLAKTLSLEKVNVKLVARSYEAPVDILPSQQVPLFRLSSRTTFGFIADVIRELYKQRPTHVITSANDISCLLIALKLLYFREIRIIVTQHSTLSATLTHSHGIKRLKLIMVRWAMRCTYPHADALVAVSKGVANDLAESLELNPTAISVIYNPIIDEQTAQQIEAPLPANFSWLARIKEPLIVFAGRLEPGKRVDLLLEAYAKVRQQYQARLLILGSGSLRENFEKQAKQLNLEKEVVFLGYVENILPILKISTVLVLASDVEGFGNVLVEAMICGTQVIATDCPFGPAEILEHGRYGQLTPLGSIESITEALLKTLNKEFHAPEAELQRRATYFSVERAGRAYLQLLEGVCP